jgi:flagellar hook-length control protein FliK
MTIPLSVIGTAINIVDKLFSSGGDKKAFSGSPNDPKAPSGFRDAMKLASLAKVVGDKIGNADKLKLEQLVNDKDIQKATELLQSLVGQLFGGNNPSAAAAAEGSAATAAMTAEGLAATTAMTAAPGTTPTSTPISTSTPTPVATAQPQGLQLTANDALHVRGVTTLGTPGALGPTYNADGTPKDLSAYLKEGMQPTPQQAPTPVNPQQTPAVPVAVATPVPTPPLVSTAVVAPTLTGDIPLEAIPEAKSETSATAGVKGLVTDPQNALASLQNASGGNGANSGNSDQETFFMFNALKREMKGPVEGLEAPPDMARNLPPGLTLEAPRGFGMAQVEGALQPQIDTQKLIDKIMDGVFRPPVQLPKVVTLDLNPAHLGKLQVQVSMHDDGVRVQMTTANPLVKAALEQGMQDLKTAMNNSGLQLGHLDVNVKQDNQSRSFAQQQHHQQQQGNGSGRLRSLSFGGGDDALDGLSSALGRAAPVRAAMAALSAVNAFA